jgi:hypothetical protein
MQVVGKTVYDAGGRELDMFPVFRQGQGDRYLI